MKYPFQTAIEAAARKHGLDPDLVAAVCYVESSFRPEAIRYEPAFQKKYIDVNHKYQDTPEATRRLLASSLGIMQVMGVVAVEYGLEIRYLNWLVSLDTGLDYGCRHLARYMKKYGLDDAVAAYNSGTPKRDKNGIYRNQGYVTKVLEKYREYRGSNSLNGSSGLNRIGGGDDAA